MPARVRGSTPRLARPRAAGTELPSGGASLVARRSEALLRIAEMLGNGSCLSWSATDRRGLRGPEAAFACVTQSFRASLAGPAFRSSGGGHAAGDPPVPRSIATGPVPERHCDATKQLAVWPRDAAQAAIRLFVAPRAFSLLGPPGGVQAINPPARTEAPSSSVPRSKNQSG